MTNQNHERLAANQALFRQVNESINRGSWPGENGNAIGFRCECAEVGCNALVTLTPDEYENVRAHPRRFVVLPGHELRFLESVVATRPGYVVVEKRGEAGMVATAEDPRS